MNIELQERTTAITIADQGATILHQSVTTIMNKKNVKMVSKRVMKSGEYWKTEKKDGAARHIFKADIEHGGGANGEFNKTLTKGVLTEKRKTKKEDDA